MPTDPGHFQDGTPDVGVRGLARLLERQADAEEEKKEGMPFAATKRVIRRGDEIVASAISNNMAKRIANALNAYTPDRRGI